jgi:hypothetical protein
VVATINDSETGNDGDLWTTAHGLSANAVNHELTSVGGGIALCVHHSMIG